MASDIVYRGTTAYECRRALSWGVLCIVWLLLWYIRVQSSHAFVDRSDSLLPVFVI